MSIPARTLSGLVAIVTVAGAASAQSLSQRVASSRGVVAFEFTTRPNVCGDGMSITISDDTSSGWSTRRRRGISVGRHESGRVQRCDTGPARVVVRHEGDRVTDVRVTVGGASSAADTELGHVASLEAASYLLTAAPRLNGRGADHAIIGAQIAADAVVWPRLLEIARNDGATASARKTAVFWLGQEAAAAAAAGLADVAADDDADVSVRSDAVFYLAQRPNGEGIPSLIRVVRASKSAKLRKDAVWHLAQSRDPRALEFFEELLSGR